MSCCPTSGRPAAEAEQLAGERRVEKATARLSIEAMAKQALRQCAATAIAAVQTASTMFAMAAMLGRHTTQLKMPRPDAYVLEASIRSRQKCRVLASRSAASLN